MVINVQFYKLLFLFRRAYSDQVRVWLQALSKNGAPIHICLTHADELYAECKAEGKLDIISEELKVNKRFLIISVVTSCVFLCLTEDSLSLQS